MTYFEWFLFIWLGMALIKIVIIFATMIDWIIKYGNPEQSVLILSRSFILGSSTLSVLLLLSWPYSLFIEGFGYFVFPNKNLQKIMKKHYEDLE